MKKVTAVVMALALTVFCSVAAAQEKASAQSDSALPLLVDVEKIGGWMAYVEGGYQWNFFRGVGIEMNKGDTQEYYSKRNYTKGGIAGAVAFGYNFCPKFPLTLGLKIGAGPSNKLETVSLDGNTRHWERIGLYTFDFALDYDFKNKSRFTPFVGINFGAALISQKARAWHTDDVTGENFFGKYDTRRRVNFIGGARTGVKYDINPRIALTLFGQYSYLGTIRGKSFAMEGDLDSTMEARTLKIKAHMVEAKLGVRIAF